MTGATPIRPGVEPELDVAREMRDYAWQQIADYIARYGVPPHSIAIVLLGSPTDGDAASDAFSWTPANEQASRLHACAAASALLMKRAIDE